MICFKDMTFCPYWKKCKKGNKCFRALTKEVEDKANKWWGKGNGKPPICFFAEKPKCFKEI